MNYRKIPQLVADELRPLEAYTYLERLASKSDYNTLERQSKPINIGRTIKLRY